LSGKVGRRDSVGAGKSMKEKRRIISVQRGKSMKSTLGKKR